MNHYKCRCNACKYIMNVEDFYISRFTNTIKISNEDGSSHYVESVEDTSIGCPICGTENNYDYVFKCPFCNEYHSTDEFVNNTVCVECFKKQARNIARFINFCLFKKDYSKLEIYFRKVGGMFDFATLIADGITAKLNDYDLNSVKDFQEIIVENEFKDEFTNFYFGTKEIK